VRSHLQRHRAINPAAPERHYLPFDGLVDRAYAQAVRVAGGTEYALVTKVANTGVSGADNYLAHLSVPGNTSPAGANISDVTRRVISTGQRYSVIGLTAAGATNYSRASVSDAVAAVDTGAVYMVGRNLTTNLARGRVVGADQAIRWTFADLAAATDTEPLDVCIGAALSHAFSPFAGTYYAIGWVASLVLRIVPTDAQLQAYAATNDALSVWSLDQIDWYATASGLLARGSGPIVPRVGASLLNCVGPTEADLVSL
jgi:hypothetical protein